MPESESVVLAQDTQESLAEPDPTATPGATVTEEHEQQEKQRQEASPADRPSTAPPEPSVPGTPDSGQPQVQYSPKKPVMAMSDHCILCMPTICRAAGGALFAQ